ncbi:hypothetical protein SH467x_000366 [Pirellulaceae bacterium SH467]
MTEQKLPSPEQIQALTAAIDRLALVLEKIAPALADIAETAILK